jgi:sugar lactone lactonase YvrE
VTLYASVVIRDDLLFGEGPRWRDGRLWFSDFFAHVVRALTPTGEAEDVVEVPNQPSGLGWLPDGSLLVVSMTDQRVMRLDGEVLVEHADLSGLATGHCNDMVVDSSGRAYVGNFGSDVGGGEALRPATLALVLPDGRVEPAADELQFPNGMVIEPDERTLIVAETFGERLTAFDIDGDGRLHRRRVWAPLPGVHPDGCCLDAAGGVWVADPPKRRCVRVVEGGEITDEVTTTRPCIACMLGGTDGRTLFLVTTWFADVENRPGQEMGAVETVEVEHAHAGRP